MKTIQVGTKLRINNWTAVVLRIDGGYALIKTQGGSQICYGINGIRQNQIEDQLTLAL